MTSALKMNLISYSIVIVGIVLAIAMMVSLYRKNKAKLDIFADAIKIQPSKARFFIAWLVYVACDIAPFILLIWIIPSSEENRVGLSIVYAIMFPLLAMPAYPYYTIATYERTLNGPPLWGWGWRREEIALSDIDREKTLHRNFGRKLGILIFYSKGGKKMLSLGLSASQVNQILTLASDASAVNK